MTNFSKSVAGCIAVWGKRVAESDGSEEQLENASKELRSCLDKAFPDSEKLNLQGDKVNYMLSSVFFLANRLAKANQGLSEFDKIVPSAESLAQGPDKTSPITEKTSTFNRKLDDILEEYF